MSILRVANVQFNASGTRRIDYDSVADDGIIKVSAAAVKLPVGDNASRPASQAGMIRYNSDTGYMEFGGSTNWVAVASNVAFDIANAAYTMANVAYNAQNVDYTLSNTAFGVANAAFAAINSNFTVTNTVYGVANAAFASANNVAPQVTPAYNTANLAYASINSNWTVTNTVYSVANAALQNSSTIVFAGKANNTTLFNGISPVTFASALRANRNLTGGGTITVDGSNNVLWSARFIVLGNGRGSNFSTSGYFDINCPTSGTITGVGGAASQTATASGIPLGTWTAIYYILPIGSDQTSLAANFRLVSYTADVDVPHDWLLICWRNGDDNLTYFNNGIRLAPGQSIASGATNPISNSSSGYTKFTNGFILQWGNFSLGDGGTQNVTFPIAFSTACYAVNVTQIYQNGADQYQNGVRCTGFPSTTGVSIRQNTNGTNSFFWVALGF